MHLFCEYAEKIEKTDLEFKCNYPEEKMMAVLDGQKTYRIFENLIVNVTKYAMPHTRVFVDIFREENEIVVQMKNVSKDELTFNPQEITERFVRGDESRNSEGSGLGLAIVRSFTELQGGHFHVFVCFEHVQRGTPSQHRRHDRNQGVGHGIE